MHEKSGYREVTRSGEDPWSWDGGKREGERVLIGGGGEEGTIRVLG